MKVVQKNNCIAAMKVAPKKKKRLQKQESPRLKALIPS